MDEHIERTKRVFNKAPRDPKRIDQILHAIRAIWQQSPDLRLGQILCNATTIPDDAGSTRPTFSNNPYYFEDNDLLQALRQYATMFPYQAR